GLEVYTTIDMAKQKAAERALAEGLRELDKRQGFRGPLAELTEKEEKPFLDKYQKTLAAGPLDDAQFYVALVKEVSNDRALVNIGTTKVQIPLAAMRWARKPNPLIAYEYQLVDDARKVVKRGDVVFVKRITKQELSKWKSALGAMSKL